MIIKQRPLFYVCESEIVFKIMRRFDIMSIQTRNAEKKIKRGHLSVFNDVKKNSYHFDDFTHFFW